MPFSVKVKIKSQAKGPSRRLLVSLSKLAQRRQVEPTEASQSTGLSPTENVDLPPRRATPGQLFGG